MRRARLFLIVALALAVAWTAWLAYEAATIADPIVVSRPQILVAPIVVEATVGDRGDQRVKVVVVYRGEESLGLKEGEREPEHLEIAVPELAGVAADNYLLALQEDPDKKGVFALVPIPLSPGFSNHSRKPPIYPATPSTRLQVRETLREYHKRLAGE